jgi:site-specific DNA recombinase
MNITELKPTPILPSEIKKRRVCAYARVSSEKDIAQSSFEMQIRAYTESITSRPDWVFCGVFADEGKSGTSTTRRTQFQLMMEVASAGKIDLILTKSISRFARNVVDCLESIRTLKRAGVEVFFETDNISSFDERIEFVISVLAAMAEEEARNVSENVKWNVQTQFAMGKATVVTKRLLGYDTDDSGNLVINRYQAEIVRTIFRMYIFGSSMTAIAEELERRGVKTTTGNAHWCKSTINYILKNDIYTGGMTLQKTYRPDFHSKLKKLNKGERTRYEVENSHPAIISKADFEHVQLRMMERNSKPIDVATPQTNHSDYTGKFRCGICGKNYRLRWNNRHSNNPSRILVCASNVDKKTCNNEIIFADVADAIIQLQIESVKQNQVEFFKALEEHFKHRPDYLEDVKAHEQLITEINHLQNQIKDLQPKQDEIAIDIVKELMFKEHRLQQKRIAIENRFHTVYNFNNHLERYKKVLQKDKIEFEDLFDHIDIIDRNHWVFRLEASNLPLSYSSLVQGGTYTFFIRKTTHTIQYSLSN